MPTNVLMAGLIGLLCGGLLAGCNSSDTVDKKPAPPVSVQTPAVVAAPPALSGLITEPLPGGFVYYNDADLRDSTPPMEAVLVPKVLGSTFYNGELGPVEQLYMASAEHVQAMVEPARRIIRDGYPPLAIREAEYRWQVVGVVQQDRDLLFVNAFCEDHPDWTSRVMFVKDGGPCYFQFLFDPETQTIPKLMINGKS